jgi:hypothetical protein
MSRGDYEGCLDRAARATHPTEIAALRAELVERWKGDPRAEDLLELLYEHEATLGGSERQRWLNLCDSGDEVRRERRPNA